MDLYYPVNALMLAVAGWALWVRWDAWRSPWDRPMNISIVLQVVGTVLTSRVPQLRSVMESLFGLGTVSALSVFAYAASVVFAILAVYKRLLSDNGIGPFMTTRVLWPMAAAAIVMVPAFWLSRSVQQVGPGAFLYLAAARDGWLTVYQTAFLVMMLYLLVIVERGMVKLREQAPESFDICYLLWARFGMLTVVVQIVGLFVNVSAGFEYGSILADLAGVLMALGAGRSWVKRARFPAMKPRSPLQG